MYLPLRKLFVIPCPAALSHKPSISFIRNFLLAFVSLLLSVSLPTLVPLPLWPVISLSLHVSTGSSCPSAISLLITRRISPNMAVISLKCNSSSWACSLSKSNVDGSYHFGFTLVTFSSLPFPCTQDFKADTTHFAFASYLLSTSGGKGRVSTETPQTKQKDAGATQVTLLTGICSLSCFALRIALITIMHVKAVSSPNSVFLSSSQ